MRGALDICKQNIEAFCDLLQAENLNFRLAGYSFGSYIALQAYHQVNADRLLLVAPALEHFDDELQLKETPTLVIQGSHDEVVLPEVVAEWTTSQQHQPQVQWINEADHFFHGKLNDLREAMMQEW